MYVGTFLKDPLKSENLEFVQSFSVGSGKIYDKRRNGEHLRVFQNCTKAYGSQCTLFITEFSAGFDRNWMKAPFRFFGKECFFVFDSEQHSDDVTNI